MSLRLDSNEVGFERDFAALLALKREMSQQVDQTVSKVIFWLTCESVVIRRSLN